MNKRNIKTSEIALAGHPDKIADQIAFLFVKFALKQKEKMACEVLVSSNCIYVSGETTISFDKKFLKDIFKKKIINLIYKIGYFKHNWKALYNENIIIDFNKQNENIAKQVNKKHIGAGDNTTAYGFAINNEFGMFPKIQHYLVLMSKHIFRYFKSKGFGVDGKIQIAYNGYTSEIKRISINASTNHKWHKKNDAVIKSLAKKINVDKKLFYIYTYPVGGPQNDTGLTGRKLMCDTYGTFSKHGGGNFTGKDPTKGDLTLALYARKIAKQSLICNPTKISSEIQVSITMGETGVPYIWDGSKCNHFGNIVFEDIIKIMNLKRYYKINMVRYGWFGNNTKNTPWEKTIKCVNRKENNEKNN